MILLSYGSERIKRRPQPIKASAAAILVWPWLSRKVGACARMGRVQGGARAAFATPSWGPARMTYFFHFKKVFRR